MTALVMAAFAGNSILNRLAVGEGLIAPLPFAALRLAAGAGTLVLLALLLGRGLPLLGRRRLVEAPALTLYMLGFSAAYLRLDAGTGALILFGTVQVVMFAAALRTAVPGPLAWMGAGIALSGLALLSAGGTAPAGAAALMGAAGAGWAVYSLSGRAAGDPLAATAANFAWAAVGTAILLPLLPGGAAATGQGALLAVLAGAMTSGLGYALWYAVLPRHAPEAAALWQLTVPALAVAGGAVLLAEPAGPRTLAALALVASGVALGLRPQRRIGSSGS